MKSISLLLLCLFCCTVVEVHSHIAPYLTFKGEILPNHAFVELSEVGLGSAGDEKSTNEIVCHTDLDSCCRNSDHGGWLFPNRTELPGAGLHNANSNSIAQRRLDSRVRLQRGPISSKISAISSGVYQCDIAVIDESGTRREVVYVGVYESGGMCRIM